MHIFLGIAEDNLNISLKDITVTGRDGRVSQLDQVYIRGSMVRFFIVPDMLQNAPMYEVSPPFSFFCMLTACFFISFPADDVLFMTDSVMYVHRFKRVGPNAMRGRGIGTARGRATIMRGALLVVIYIFISTDFIPSLHDQPMVRVFLLLFMR